MEGLFLTRRAACKEPIGYYSSWETSILERTYLSGFMSAMVQFSMEELFKRSEHQKHQKTSLLTTLQVSKTPGTVFTKNCSE